MCVFYFISFSKSIFLCIHTFITYIVPVSLTHCAFRFQLQSFHCPRIAKETTDNNHHHYITSQTPILNQNHPLWVHLKIHSSCLFFSFTKTLSPLTCLSCSLHVITSHTGSQLIIFILSFFYRQRPFIKMDSSPFATKKNVDLEWRGNVEYFIHLHSFLLVHR